MKDKITPSVKERRKNAPFFHQCYSDLCKLRNTVPNPLLKAQAGKYILDFCGDRIKIDEWAPILESLKHDRSLHFIAIRSRYPDKKVMEEVDTEAKARTVTKRPVFLTKFILKLLLDALSTCIAESTSITCIELEGLPLTLDYLSILCKGLSSNVSLQTISFCNSPIGDEGCKQICLFLRNMPSVYHVDLTNCDLSSYSASELAETLKYQTLQRYAESWKQSLRYREPDIEAMPGLRRIILNNNTLVGDDGAKYLTEVLKEDLWLRAIDLQNCGITNAGAQEVLEMLDLNGTLCIVDLRDNRAIEETLTHQIMLKLFHNNANKDAHEYNWIIPRSQLSNVPSSQSLRSRQSASTKRVPSLKSATSVVAASSLQKCKSLYTARRNPSDRKITSTNDPPHLKHHTVSSHSTSAISQRPRKLLTSTECVPKILESKQRLKDESGDNPSSSYKNSESSSRKTIFDSTEKDNSSQSDKKEEFCYVKAAAYDAVFEALGGFSSFMRRIKDANSKTFPPVMDQSGDGSAEFSDDTLHAQRAVSDLLAMDKRKGADRIMCDAQMMYSEESGQENVKQHVLDCESVTMSSGLNSPRYTSDPDSRRETDMSYSYESGTLTSSLSKIHELYENLIKVNAVPGTEKREE